MGLYTVNSDTPVGVRIPLPNDCHTHTFLFLYTSHPSLTPNQHTCLEKLYLPSLYHTLKIFVQWSEEGWYDYCSLPFAAKMQMSVTDEEIMRQIASTYDGQFTNPVEHQDPIMRRSFQLIIMATEHVYSNHSNLTVPLFGTSLPLY